MTGLIRLYFEPRPGTPVMDLLDEFQLLSTFPRSSEAHARPLRAGIRHWGAYLMAGFNSTLGGSASTSYISITEADDLLRLRTTQQQSNTEAEKSGT